MDFFYFGRWRETCKISTPAQTTLTFTSGVSRNSQSRTPSLDRPSFASSVTSSRGSSVEIGSFTNSMARKRSHPVNKLQRGSIPKFLTICYQHCSLVFFLASTTGKYSQGKFREDPLRQHRRWRDAAVGVHPPEWIVVSHINFKDF